MKKSINNLAAGVLAALVPANILHSGWTVWLTMEQIETGWDGGTGIEMLALLLWLMEALCVPVLILGFVYLVMSCFRWQKKWMLITNIILFTALFAQIFVTNLFLFY